MTSFETLSCLSRYSKHALSNMLITNEYLIYIVNKSMQILIYIILYLYYKNDLSGRIS